METNSEHLSSYESLSLNNYDDSKSPESSDWEDYATPLAGSLTSLPEMQIDIVPTPEGSQKSVDSRELTPVICVDTSIDDLFLRNDEEIVEEIVENIVAEISENERKEKQALVPRSIITPVGCSNFLDSSSSDDENETEIHDQEIVAILNNVNAKYPATLLHEIREEPEDEEEINTGYSDLQNVSDEFEQLVAAISSFGKKKDENDDGVEKIERIEETVLKNGIVKNEEKQEDGESCYDQKWCSKLDKFNQVDLTDPLMDNLKMENNQLRLENEELAEELLNLQRLLKEANHTIDEIEVEAEQQYTEMTSEIDELCEVVMKKDGELAGLKEKLSNMTMTEKSLKDDIDSQKTVSQRQKEIIEGLRDEVEGTQKKLADMTKSRDKAVEEATLNKIKSQERERFLAKEAQLSVEIEDLQRELNKQKLILNQTSMSKLADTFEKKIFALENDVRERDMLICKQNQIINGQRRSPTGLKKPFGGSRAAALAAEIPSAGSSSESFQHGLDQDAKDTIMSFILSDRHMQLANIYNIGRILELNTHEERALERHLTRDRFT